MYRRRFEVQLLQDVPFFGGKMSTQLVEFPPVVCSDDTDAVDLILSMFDCAKELGRETILQIGTIATMIKPDADPTVVLARFLEKSEQNRNSGQVSNSKSIDVWTWIADRRQGGDRRQFLRDDGRERRKSKLPPLPE